jgi:hypothetical protein
MLACYDFTPNTEFSPLVLSADAGAEAAVDAAAVVAACLACVSPEAGACGAAYGTCLSTPKCEPFFVCGIRLGCYAPNADKLGCLTKCGFEAQISGLSDPAVGPFIALDKCVSASCSSACNP